MFKYFLRSSWGECIRAFFVLWLSVAPHLSMLVLDGNLQEIFYEWIFEIAFNGWSTFIAGFYGNELLNKYHRMRVSSITAEDVRIILRDIVAQTSDSIRNPNRRYFHKHGDAEKVMFMRDLGLIWFHKRPGGGKYIYHTFLYVVLTEHGRIVYGNMMQGLWGEEPIIFWIGEQPKV